MNIFFSCYLSAFTLSNLLLDSIKFIVNTASQQGLRLAFLLRLLNQNKMKFRFFGFEFDRDFSIKNSILVIKFRFLSVYSDFFSHSFRFCVRSKWQVWISTGLQWKSPYVFFSYFSTFHLVAPSLLYPSLSEAVLGWPGRVQRGETHVDAATDGLVQESCLQPCAAWSVRWACCNHSSLLISQWLFLIYDKKNLSFSCNNSVRYIVFYMDSHKSIIIYHKRLSPYKQAI